MEVPIGAFAGLAGPPAMTLDGFSTDGPDGAVDDEPPLLCGALLELLFGPASDLPPS